MKLIVCIDDNFGMLFNKRRQSKDKLLIKDLIADNKKVVVNEFSKELFQNYENLIVDDDLTGRIGQEDEYIFDENILPSLLENKIDEIVIYKWNRNYPSDFKFDIDLSNWIEINTEEFVGNSHDKITKIIYIRG